MKIGYPCINLRIGCRSDRTFRLKSWSRERFRETVANNLRCLRQILEFNAGNNILFFRITSDLIPFASHPVCDVAWQHEYADEFSKIGEFICDHSMRISMHPDQFIVLNTQRDDVLERSVRELEYHADVLDLLGLDTTAKIQLHIGGAYGDKESAINRFIERYEMLEKRIRQRLVIENDDTIYTLEDCLRVNRETGVPVLFDTLHHSLNPSKWEVHDAVRLAGETWDPKDGILMVDYSTHLPGGSRRRHADTIEITHFLSFLEVTRPYDFDIMLEIKDKEASAISAVAEAGSDPRFIIP